MAVGTVTVVDLADGTTTGRRRVPRVVLTRKSEDLSAEDKSGSGQRRVTRFRWRLWSRGEWPLARVLICGGGVWRLGGRGLWWLMEEVVLVVGLVVVACEGDGGW